ncbi:MAG: hypothetical protein Q9195_009306 [Heterodermia aff. obscurata]
MSSMSRAAFFGWALAVAGFIALCRHLSPQHDTTEDDKQGQMFNHQSKAEKTNNKGQDQDFQIIFKVFLRPVTAEDNHKSASDLKQETQDYVRTAFKVDSKVQIKVRSAVVDSFSNARIATLSFSKIPDSIKQDSTTQETISRSKDLPDISLDLNLDFDGLTPLFSGGIEQQSLDIVAVHGLGGHAIGSYKAENEDNMWLRDNLPRDLPNCRIYTFGYSSRVPDSSSFQTLYDLGLTLQKLLEQLVIHNKEAVDKLFKSNNTLALELIRGILFFGTPNQGMDNSKFLAMAEGGPNEDLLKSLGYDSETLRRQASDFENAIKSPRLKNLEIFSYFETELSRTYKKIDGKWKKEGELVKLVDRNSATNGRPGDDQKPMLKYRSFSSKPSWHSKWMKDFLENEIPQACKSQSLRIIIIVDAIDECIDECDEEDRTDIMSFLRSLISKSDGDNLRIFVSFSPGKVSEEGDIDMAHHNHKDIATYVQNKLSTLPETKLSISPRSNRSIPVDIQKRAQGMFLWAEIACNKAIEMDAKGKPAEAILQAIESLPKKLDDMFLEVVEDVTPEDAGETLKLFRWICFAQRPLSIAELRYAIMIDPGMKETSIDEIHKNPNFRKEQRDMIRAIFYLSRGLAKIVNRTREDHWLMRPKHYRSTLYATEHEKEVRFIHECVHEFLLTRGLGRLTGSHSSDSDEEVTSSGHSQLSRSCLKYLSMKECLLCGSSTDAKELPTADFLEYASSSWLFHTEHVERAKKPQHDVLKLLQWPSANIFNNWIRVRPQFLTLEQTSAQNLVPHYTPGPSLLHILAAHGLVSLLEDIFGSSDDEGNRANVKSPTDDPFVKDEEMSGEHDKAVISCFEPIKVNADVQDDAGGTPLWYAVNANQTAAAKLLLKIKHVKHVNPNPIFWLGFSPLQLAACRGSAEIMEVFFEFPERRIDVIELLVDHAATNWFHGPEVIKILIDKGLPEVKLTEALVIAVANNNGSTPDVLRTLIQDARLEKDLSEQILAPILRRFDLETVQIFLQKRCSKMAISEDILLAAAGNDRDGPRILEFLLTREISATRITNEVVKTVAMNRKGPMMMKSFLERGLEIEITPEVLYSALRNWHHGAKVMRRLLQRTVPVIDWKRTLRAATEAIDTDSAQEMMMVLLEERESELKSALASEYIGVRFLVRVLSRWTKGEQVVNLMLRSGYFPMSISDTTITEATKNCYGYPLIKFLLQWKGEEVRPLLSAEVWREARQSWGDSLAESILSEDSSDSEDPHVKQTT